eukprot:116125-Pyramimonas_sp.AAC.1
MAASFVSAFGARLFPQAIMSATWPESAQVDLATSGVQNILWDRICAGKHPESQVIGCLACRGC